MEGFKRKKPPATPQIAAPVIVPEKCNRKAKKLGINKAKSIGDLVLMAF